MEDDSDFEIKDSLKDSKEKLAEDLAHYRTTLQFMGANVPIEVLCLPTKIQNVLLKDGRLRVYDLIGRDLGEIKGLGLQGRSLLASRLDEFFSVSL
jgi:hypothetical protein